MRTVIYNGEPITIYEYDDAREILARLANENYGDITTVCTKGNGRNRTEYYNYACSFDIETTTIRPGELDYIAPEDAPPLAFPYLFQWNIYGRVIMCRTYGQARDVFAWISELFRLGGNRRMILFDHNAGYEEFYFRSIWQVEPEKCFALDEHHPVTIATKDGFLIRDSYKMSNMSLESLTKDWSVIYKKEKEIMDYSVLRTPYTELDDNTLLYSALDVLSLSEAIMAFLAARGEYIWTNCPTSTSFIRKELKKRIGVGVKQRSDEQKKYYKVLAAQRVTFRQFQLLMRLARGGNTHANRAITGILLAGLLHADITSSYPAQAVCYPEFPLGIWQDIDTGAYMEDIELLEANGYCTMFDVVLINARLKEGVTVPYISISKMTIVKGSGMKFTDNGRYMYGLEAIKLSIFGVEWPIIRSQYEFDDAIITEGYYSRKGYLPDIVRRFIMELYEKKTKLKGIEGQEVEYALAKTYINGVFGMAYTSPLRDTYEVTMDGIFLKPPEDPAEHLERYQNSISYFMPYAWGAMIACLGRVYLQKMIDAVGEDFCYCDTDSIFCTNYEKNLPKILALEKEITEYQRRCGLELTYYDIKGCPHELGAISIEKYVEYFKTYGSKKYITVEDGQLTCTIAGVPKKAGSRIIGTPDNFKLGMNFKGSETGKNCLWYNPDPGRLLHDEQGRPIDIHYNVAMLPCDYLLSISNDYAECLSIEGNFHWNMAEADKNTINEEDL